MIIQKVNKIFQPSSPEYPKGIVEPSIEEYAMSWIEHNGIESKAIYLPVFWNAYMHILKNKHESYRTALNNMLGTLNRKVFTVSQYDIDIPDRPECLNVASAGGEGHFSIPYIPFNWSIKTDNSPKYLAGFVGNVETNPTIRGPLIEEMSQHADVFIVKRNWTDRSAFRYALENCRFMLCPRGYGKTSYRLYEAIQAGCIPVYYSDDHWLPFIDVVDWNKLAILANENESETIYDQMKTMPESEIKERQEYGQIVMRKYFTPDKIMSQIKKWIESC